MDIILEKISKRFNQSWLFKDLDYRLSIKNSYAITGPNGSGKTTLLKIISGMIPPTKGSVSYQVDDQSVDPDDIYNYLSFVAPYMEVIEDLSLQEFFSFHFNLKPLAEPYNIPQVAKLAGLGQALKRPIHTFSSGMRQRVKLALGLYAKSPLLLLDEPTTNLDDSGIAWYHQEMTRVRSEKLVIISSNQPLEYEFCNHIINLTE